MEKVIQESNENKNIKTKSMNHERIRLRTKGENLSNTLMVVFKVKFSDSDAINFMFRF